MPHLHERRQNEVLRTSQRSPFSMRHTKCYFSLIIFLYMSLSANEFMGIKSVSRHNWSVTDHSILYDRSFKNALNAWLQLIIFLTDSIHLFTSRITLSVRQRKSRTDDERVEDKFILIGQFRI